MIALSFCLINSCSSDELPPLEGCTDTNVRYTTNVKEIIDQTCSYSGCHNGVGSSPGDFRSFDGLKRYIEDGSFTERVIDQRTNPSKGMPPDMSVYPESQQDDLSDVQLEIITCWIQNNFPE